MSQVNFKCFQRQKVHWNGISAEGVNHQNVKIMFFVLVQFAFEGETPVAWNHLNPGQRIAQIAEVFPVTRDLNDIRIDFIETKNVSRPAVCSNRADAQPDDADPEISLGARGFRHGVAMATPTPLEGP